MKDELGGVELSISRLAQAVAYPSTPDLAARVRARITARAAAVPARPSTWGIAGTAVAAAVVALVVVVGVLAPAREAIADLFDRINVFQAEEIPNDLPTDIRGEQTTLEEATRLLGRPIALPTETDGAEMEPSKVLYQQFAPGGPSGVVLFFEPSDGAAFLVFETDAGLGKGLGAGASAALVRGLGDGEAYWLEGLRIVQSYDAEGNLIRESQRRTETNTLVWIQNDLVFRLEGDLSEDEALRIARSLK